jgi:NodT family efflux transporter outer membrane factor (OMF) lipoprotein
MGSCGLDQWAKNGFKVGPNFKTPSAPLAADWIDYRTSTTQPVEQVNPANWWSVFHDPVLDNLMHDAYGQNLSLRQAGERIAQARALRGIAVGNMFPQLQEAAGSWTANKTSDRAANPLPNNWFHDVNAGFNIGWEIDFWGRYRRALEAADATLEASVAEFDDVMVLLLADVGSNYIQYRTFQQRLFLAKQNADIQRQAFELAQNNFRAGAATERDMQQARQVYEQTRSLIPQFEQGLRQTNNRLCVLLGIPAQDLAPRLGDSGIIPTAPAEVAVGIPADLLRRRPDIRRAERRAAAESAQIGVAQSELYPHFAINGSIGVDAQYFGGLFHSPGAIAGSIGPSFQWNILNYGRLENATVGQEARFREFISRYQETVLDANRDAEDALVAFAKSKERTVFLSESVAAAERTVQITYDQYRAGTVDFTPVFLFEATLTQQQDSLAQAQGDIALSLVSLYRALGGGWEARMKPEGIVGPRVPAPTTQRAPTRPDLLNPTGTRPAARPR